MRVEHKHSTFDKRALTLLTLSVSDIERLWNSSDYEVALVGAADGCVVVVQVEEDE